MVVLSMPVLSGPFLKSKSGQRPKAQFPQWVEHIKSERGNDPH